MKLSGKVVRDGEAKGEALVSEEPISFLGGIDPETGEVIEQGHQLENKCVKNRVLVFPHGKGSTVGSYVLYQLARNGNAPVAIINDSAEPIVAVGAIIADIPMVHKLDKKATELIEDGDIITIQGKNVRVEKIGSTSRKT
ncbi:hypothetical protein AKJ37_00300 [candidate division MSBL1 archaeon SCGC-AAA259I09]|uniref:Phosphomevalonate dehydratase small subunit n=1 Tax=candidate division MSBL1 archaeon SCGC-AAA259I09 TaxID=1698267 RepID=A0A133UVW9_9EURY|nr:hypothetical protein AKJ37_00300 [candidate division MSBL1 archaeon SCGC-AAA259I09]